MAPQSRTRQKPARAPVAPQHREGRHSLLEQHKMERKQLRPAQEKSSAENGASAAHNRYKVGSLAPEGTLIWTPKNSGASAPLWSIPRSPALDSSLPLLHHLPEVAEQVVRIVRAGRRLRVILHGEQRQRLVPQPFQRLVVQVNVRQFLLVDVDRIWIDGKVVIVRGDLYLARGVIAHRMVAAMMAKLQFVSAPAQSQPAKLVPQADAENRHSSHHLANRLDRIIHRLGISGSVRQEHAIWLERQRVFCGRFRRHHRYPASLTGYHPQYVMFVTKIISHHMKVTITLLRQQGLS